MENGALKSALRLAGHRRVERHALWAEHNRVLGVWCLAVYITAPVQSVLAIVRCSGPNPDHRCLIHRSAPQCDLAMAAPTMSKLSMPVCETNFILSESAMTEPITEVIAHARIGRRIICSSGEVNRT